MFITPAYAQASPPGGGDIFIQMLPFVAIFAIMYFLIIRPQQQRLKAHRDMVAAIKRNDTVVTAGGIIGKVSKVINDDEVQVDIGEGVKVKVVRGTIAEVRAKGEPVKGD